MSRTVGKALVERLVKTAASMKFSMKAVMIFEGTVTFIHYFKRIQSKYASCAKKSEKDQQPLKIYFDFIR